MDRNNMSPPKPQPPTHPTGAGGTSQPGQKGWSTDEAQAGPTGQDLVGGGGIDEATLIGEGRDPQRGQHGTSDQDGDDKGDALT